MNARRIVTITGCSDASPRNEVLDNAGWGGLSSIADVPGNHHYVFLHVEATQGSYAFSRRLLGDFASLASRADGFRPWSVALDSTLEKETNL